MLFNKADIIRALSTECGISKKDAGKFLNAFIHIIMLETDRGSAISIPGFGTFTKQERAQRRGKNIYSGDVNIIPASSTIHFKASAKVRKYMTEAPLKE